MSKIVWRKRKSLFVYLERYSIAFGNCFRSKIHCFIILAQYITKKHVLSVNQTFLKSQKSGVYKTPCSRQNNWHMFVIVDAIDVKLNFLIKFLIKKMCLRLVFLEISFFDFTDNQGHNILAFLSQNPKNRNSSPYIMCHTFVAFDDGKKPLDMWVLLWQASDIASSCHYWGKPIVRSKELKAQG